MILGLTVPMLVKSMAAAISLKITGFETAIQQHIHIYAKEKLSIDEWTLLKVR